MLKEGLQNQQLTVDHGSDRRRWLVILDALAVAAFAVLLASIVFRLGGAVQSASAWVVVGLSLPLGYLAADLASGLVHWFCDTCFEEDTRIIGRAMIRPFREHHSDPHAITRHGFFELNGNNCLAMVPPLFFGLWAGGPTAGSTMSLFAYSLLFSFALAIFATNQFHQWAHAKKVPRMVRWLQRRRLILPPTVHNLHHSGDYSGSYCITTGWMNHALDSIIHSQRQEQPVAEEEQP